IAEALNDNRLAIQSRGESERSQVFSKPESFADAVLNSATPRFTTSGDSSLGDRFACDACEIVDPSRLESIVSVGHPGHLTLAGSHVRTGNVLAGADVILANEFGREPPSNLLELFRRVLLWVEL